MAHPASRAIGVGEGWVMSYVVAFTGHRPDKLGGYQPHNPLRDRLMAKLDVRLLEILQQHPELYCVSGMALGFDQWAAQVCVRLGIPFVAAIPFEGQEKRWPETSQQLYRTLLAKAARVYPVCSPGYLSWKMQKRNEWMVDNCQLLIAAWDRSPGGTANCVDYARRIGRSMENLLPLEK